MFLKLCLTLTFPDANHAAPLSSSRGAQISEIHRFNCFNLAITVRGCKFLFLVRQEANKWAKRGSVSPRASTVVHPEIGLISRGSQPSHGTAQSKRAGFGAMGLKQRPDRIRFLPEDKGAEAMKRSAGAKSSFSSRSVSACIRHRNTTRDHGRLLILVDILPEYLNAICRRPLCSFSPLEHH
ncbi:uncharacterized protein BDV17DRAFT_260768, partial [Aspergillus undulatus]|uniref:uncharacterized protein n=1 Tax=Aspergillus undulatus TaxID=1810928 RepID=UPI003CCD85CC